MMNYKLSWIVFFCVTAFVGRVDASVVMVGTRVIFLSPATEKTLQLKNPDAQPYVVQMQMMEENGSADNASPFTLVPPVFRMEPYTGQAVRLILTGKTLPQDKESVFYLDFTQLPALKKSQQDQNQLVIAIRSRVKVFYRPASLAGLQNEAYQLLTVRLANGKLYVENPTGFYISIRKAELLINGQNVTLANTVMLTPKSEAQWPLPKKITTLRNARLKLTLVNDYGIDIKREKVL